MASTHTPTDDVIYDLVAVQYHALKAAETADKYIEDAHDHADIRSFFEEVASQNAERAHRAHQLLGSIAGSKDAI